MLTGVPDKDTRWLWPTPLLVRTLEDHEALDEDLVPLFYAHRDKHGGDRTAATYASADDLLQRYQRPTMKRLFRAVSDALYEVAGAANERVWSSLGPVQVRVEVAGAWFQIANRFGAHNVHNHGNCSWSGVYYLQCDPAEKRRAHPSLGAQNGVTRFYGPRLSQGGGAHMDLGSAYLQESHVDVEPEVGRLVLFPAHLLHQAMPYDGDEDRMILSFNAGLRGEGGAAGLPYGF